MEKNEIEFVVPCVDECTGYVTAALYLWKVLLYCLRLLAV